jgi:hypothetical protein
VYRASRDGWQAADFHRACDGRGPTVTLVRTTRGNLFGGHLNRPWHARREWIHDPGASLFALASPCCRDPTRFDIADPACAACGDDRYGPVFGGKTGGNDLHIASRPNRSPTRHMRSRSSFPNTYGKGQSQAGAFATV